MIIGFGMVIIAILGCAMLAQGIAGAFNGVAAAEMGATLVLNQVMQPIGFILIGALGIGAGVGLGLLLPALTQIRNQHKEISQNPQTFDEIPTGEQPARLPTPQTKMVAGRIVQIPRRSSDSRVVVPIDLDDWDTLG